MKKRRHLFQMRSSTPIAARQSSRRLWVFLWLVLFGFALGRVPAQAQDVSDREIARELQKLVVAARAEKLGVHVFDSRTGDTIFELNASAPLKPASVLKVLTSLAALEILGPDYRFSTRLAAQAFRGGSMEALFVKGGGDPGFTVESAWAIARELRKRGVTRINQLVIDASLFDGERKALGQRAYQTGSSALAFNYNTLGFLICPTKPNEPALISTEPLEVPVPVIGRILTSAGKKSTYDISEVSGSAGLPSGLTRYQVKGVISAGSGCVTVYRSVSRPESLFGTAFLKLLQSFGIKVPDDFEIGSTPKDAKTIYVHQSRPLSELVRDLNHYSNNFIAEQILFALGATEDGKFERLRGLERMGKYLQSLGIGIEDFVIADASGLSHANRLPAKAISLILRRALQDERVRPEFESSLAVGERSGTLKKRKFGKQELLVRGKTGTLNGVSSLAGYVVGKSGRKYGFVVLQNGTASRVKALSFEEDVVKILGKY